MSAILDFDPHQQYSTIDNRPDFRSDAERTSSLLSIYNHRNPDIAYTERLAEELINICGAWITVYKRTRDTGNKDEVWDEDADPKYKVGVRLKGKFVPEPAEISQTRWGVDVQNQTTVNFARTSVLKQFGKETISEGDILIVPHNTLTVVQSTDLRDGIHNRVDTYRVLKSSDVGNFKYRWLYWACLVQNITGDPSIQVNFKMDPS